MTSGLGSSTTSQSGRKTLGTAGTIATNVAPGGSVTRSWRRRAGMTTSTSSSSRMTTARRPIPTPRASGASAGTEPTGTRRSTIVAGAGPGATTIKRTRWTASRTTICTGITRSPRLDPGALVAPTPRKSTSGVADISPAVMRTSSLMRRIFVMSLLKAIAHPDSETGAGTIIPRTRPAGETPRSPIGSERRRKGR